MTQWIRQPSQQSHPQFVQHFTYVDDPGAGFMFDLDAAGQPILGSGEARENHARALLGVQTGEMTDQGVLDLGCTDWDAGAIRCACGGAVELSSHWEGESCPKCGREYNSLGQLLRRGWREVCRETGELEG